MIGMDEPYAKELNLVMHAVFLCIYEFIYVKMR